MGETLPVLLKKVNKKPEDFSSAYTEYISTQKLAKLCDCNPRTIWKYVILGKIPSIRHTRDYLIPSSAIPDAKKFIKSLPPSFNPSGKKKVEGTNRE